MASVKKILEQFAVYCWNILRYFIGAICDWCNITFPHLPYGGFLTTLFFGRLVDLQN